MEININKLINKNQKQYAEISSKLKEENEDFFLVKLFTMQELYYQTATFYSNGMLFSIVGTETPDEDIYIETVNIIFNNEKGIYENILPDAPKSIFDNSEIIKSYDEHGNLIENFGGKLIYKYNRIGKLIETSYWSKGDQKWMKKIYNDCGDQEKILIIDENDTLKSLVFLTYDHKGNVVERHIYNSDFELLLYAHFNYDQQNSRTSATFYLPDNTIAWHYKINKSPNENFYVYDKDGMLVYKEIEIRDAGSTLINATFMHKKYKTKWDESINRDSELSAVALVSLSCFGENRKKWIDPYPEMGR